MAAALVLIQGAAHENTIYPPVMPPVESSVYKSTAACLTEVTCKVIYACENRGGRMAASEALITLKGRKEFEMTMEAGATPAYRQTSRPMDRFQNYSPAMKDDGAVARKKLQPKIQPLIPLEPASIVFAAESYGA